MRVSLGDQIRLQINVEQRAGLDSVKSVVTVTVLTDAGSIDFRWSREFGSDEELELTDIINRVQAILTSSDAVADAIMDSLAVVECAHDKVERFISEGTIWDCVRLIASLLIGRHGSPDAALHKLRQVREACETRDTRNGS